jgi:hypothetical protein
MYLLLININNKLMDIILDLYENVPVFTSGFPFSDFSAELTCLRAISAVSIIPDWASPVAPVVNTAYLIRKLTMPYHV